MNVKDEYVKSRVINPGGWVTGRPGVQMVQVRTKYVLNRFWEYQYVLLCHTTNKPEETSKSGRKRVLFSDKTNDKDRSRIDYSKRPRDDA